MKMSLERTITFVTTAICFTVLSMQSLFVPAGLILLTGFAVTFAGIGMESKR